MPAPPHPRRPSVLTASRAALHVAALASVLLVAPASARPGKAAPSHDAPVDEATQRARAHMKAASLAYQAKDWEAARAAYLEAWALKRHYAVAFNLADVNLRLGRHLEAAQFLEFVLSELPREHQDRRAEAEQRLAECRATLGSVTIAGQVPDTTISVDGGAPHPADAAFWLEPGHHVLVARAPGRPRVERAVDVAAGQSLTVSVEPEPPPAPPPVAPAEPVPAVARPLPPPADAPSAPLPARTIALLGGGALTLASVGFALVNVAAANDDAADTRRLQDSLAAAPGGASGAACAESPSPECAALAATLSDWQRHRELAIGGFVGAGVFAAATAATFALWPPAAARTSAVRARVAPWSSGATRGVLVTTTF